MNRRELLKASALMTGGAVAAAPLVTLQQAVPEPKLSRTEVLAKARERLYPTCRVCPVCDGVACSGDRGGISGVGTGMSFQNNFTALQKSRLLIRGVHDIKKADASTTIFGHKISFPAVCAPMGPVATRLGKGIDVMEWFEALVSGCEAAGTIGAVGDDPRYAEADVKARLALTTRHKGKALYNSKPAPNPAILKYHDLIEASGTAWISIDTDSGPKSVAELKELAKAFKTPIVVKGVMTVDDALRCIDAGIGGIAVSNHGGRRLDHTPGSAEVLPAIAARVKGQIPILADGCVQTGYDVLKYLALGADVVMVGRHLLRGAYGAGADGVALFMNEIRREFESAMLLCGVPSVAKIDRSILA